MVALAKALPWGLAVGLAGFIVNLFPLPGAYGLEFLFGGVGAFVLLRVGGARAAIIAAAVAATATVLQSGQPWTVVVTTFEMVFCMVLVRKGVNLIFADLLYWLTIGILQVILYFHFILGIGFEESVILSGRKFLNGVTVVCIGSLISFVLTAVFPHFCREATRSIRTVITEMLVSFMVVPVVLYSISEQVSVDLDSYGSKYETLSEAVEKVDLKIDRWFSDVGHDLDFAGASVLDHGEALDPLRDRLMSIRGIESDVVVARADGSVAAAISLAEAESRGARPEAIAGAVATALATSREGRLLHVPADSGANAVPILVAAVPVFSPAGHRLGFAYAILDGDRLAGEILSDLNGDISLTVSDLDGHVVMSSKAEAGAGVAGLGPTGAAERRRGENADVIRHFSLAGPVIVRDLAVLPWRLEAQYDPRSYLPEYRSRLVEFLALLLAIIFVGIGASSGAAGVVTRPLERIVRMLRTLPATAWQDVPRLQPVGLLEIDELSDALHRTRLRLQRSVGETERLAYRLESLIASAPVCLYMAELRDGALLDGYTSPRLADITGFGLRDIAVYASLRERIHADDRPSVDRQHELLATEGRFHAEYRFNRADGDCVWLSHSVVTVRDAAGAIHLVGALQDVTARKETDRVMEQNAKLIMLGEMAAGLAHELYQPLNVIRMAGRNAAAAVASGSSVEEMREAVLGKYDRIETQVGRAVSLVDHVLDFGRRPEEIPREFPVDTAIDEVLALVGQQIELAKIHISFDSVVRDARVLGSRQKLEQVLVNVVLNARDAVLDRREREGEGAPAWIRMELATGAHPDTVRLSIADSGGGIPAAIVDRIFEPFMTTKPVDKGTGLGLSLAFKFVSELGGTISAENRADGACFDIVLPTVTASAPDGPPVAR